MAIGPGRPAGPGAPSETFEPSTSLRTGRKFKEPPALGQEALLWCVGVKLTPKYVGFYEISNIC